jgi:multidrug efflux pump subunit AcrB
VTDKLEEALNTISGIDELRSVSSEGVSMIFLSFKLEKNVDVAAQEVRDRVNLAMPRMPRDVQLPTIMRIDPSATPALYVAVNGSLPLREMTDVADRLVRRQIENVTGVGEVVVLGGRKRQVNVFIDPLKLRAFGLTAFDVQRAVTGQNVSLPAGALEGGDQQHTLRLRGRVARPEELGNLVVRNADGRPGAGVGRGPHRGRQEEGETLAVRNGERGVVLSVRKQADANTVAVVDAVRERLDDIKGLLPPGITWRWPRTTRPPVRTSVAAVKEHLILGAIFAALTVLLFLGHLRSTGDRRAGHPHLAHRHLRVDVAARASPSTPSPSWRWRWRWASSSTTPSSCSRTSSATSTRRRWSRPAPPSRPPRRSAWRCSATTISLLAVFLPVAFMGGIVGAS